MNEIKDTLNADLARFTNLFTIKSNGDEQLYLMMLERPKHFFILFDFLMQKEICNYFPKDDGIIASYNKFVTLIESQVLDALLRIVCESMINEQHHTLLKYLPYLQYGLKKTLF